jgi:Chromo (CHRromatin Organisation MOdifier) domain
MLRLLTALCLVLFIISLIGAHSAATDTVEYAVEKLIDVRMDDQAMKQVLVKWEGYRRRTWEPYESIQKQLYEMVEELEQQLSSAICVDGMDDPSTGSGDNGTDSRRAFLQDYIDKHNIGASYRALTKSSRWSSPRPCVVLPSRTRWTS